MAVKSDIFVVYDTIHGTDSGDRKPRTPSKKVYYIQHKVPIIGNMEYEIIF